MEKYKRMHKNNKFRYSNIVKPTSFQKQQTHFQNSCQFKFKLLQKSKGRKKTFSQSKDCQSTSVEKDDEFDLQSIDENKNKGFNNLIKKFSQKKKLKAGTRNFQKSFYTKLANKIIEKPMSFYKFGLKQDQKVSCKSVFRQIFHIQPQRLKGTLSAAQLWDSKTSMRYLKENQMFFNKDVLLRQFHDIDKQQKQRKKQQEIKKQKEFVKRYRQLMEQNKKLNQNNLNYRQVKQMDTKQACCFIRSQIDKLVQKRYQWRVKTKSRKIIDKLQKDYQKFDQIAGKFKSQMVILL